MIFFLFFCTKESKPRLQETTTFSPALHKIVLRVQWRYGENCQGVEAFWSTSLPQGTIVQGVAGPKIENSHFDEDALQDQRLVINDFGQAHLKLSDVVYDHRHSFLNLRVWGSHPSIVHMLEKSQQQGGFAIAPSADGVYGWAEATIPPCQQTSSTSKP